MAYNSFKGSSQSLPMGTKPILKTDPQGRPASSSGYHYRNSVSTQADIYGTEPTAYENLYELYRRPYADFAPLPRWPRAYPPLPPANIHCPTMYDDGAYFMRRPKSVCSDRNSYSWYSEDEDIRLGRLPRPPDEIFDMYNYPLRRSPYFSYSTEFLTPRLETCPAHPPVPPPPPPPILPIIAHRPKHVSFARSHTLQSFDDISSARSSLSRSQERLIDGKRTMDPKDSPKVVVEKKKVKKTQATQTEVCLGRKPVPPPTYLSLSPRLGRKVKTISQGAQTNGEQSNGRRSSSFMMKSSYSELEGVFLPCGAAMDSISTAGDELRSQSEQDTAPKSPHYTPCPTKSILVYSPKTSYASTSSKTYSHASDQSTASYNRLESPSHCGKLESKEIMIDFKPNPSAEPVVRRGKKRILQKTRSEGEILVDPSLLMDEGEGSVSDSEHQYYDTYGEGGEPKEKRPPSQISCPSSAKQLNQMLSSSSQEEEFHENLVYHSIFDSEDASKQSATSKHTKLSTPDKDLPTSKQPTAGKTAQSPSVSCDSLNTRDISESHWNESQTTVLHDSEDNNATGISCSDLSASLSPAAAVAAMTPGSRRRHLLQLQHMQRSSMDTEALDTEDFDLESENTIAASTPLKSTSLTPKKEKPSPDRDLSPLSKINVNKPTTVPKFSVTLPSDEPKKIRVKKHYLSRLPHDQFSSKVSPSESSKFESAGDQHVPCDLVRSDSGRTNTDMSETSTTEDYVTANNSVITETSGNGTGTGTHGSSFESASSKHSLDRDKSEDFQTVPCGGEIKEEIDEGIDETTSKSPTHENSSSGSVDEDQYPSSIYQGVPEPRHSHPEPKSISWTDEENSKKKKHFKLELASKKKMSTETTSSPSKHISSALSSSITSPGGLKRSPTPDNKPVDSMSSMKTLRRPKHHTKPPPPSDKTSPCIETLEALVKEQRITNVSYADLIEDRLSPQRGEPVPSTPQREAIPINNGVEESSDDSSYECGCGRKRPMKESPRRKLGMRSPTSQGKSKRRSTNEERRRSLSIVKSPSPVLQRLSPSILKSPDNAKHKKSTISPEHIQVKALSAESLRSVSPGSDSVFYSEPNVTITEDLNQDEDDKTVCLPESEYRRKSIDIVQPPAGFEDSPKPVHKGSTPKHSKKMEKRFRSEERSHHARMMEAQRAKSEERHREEQKENIRPLVRSTCNSMEKLRSSSAASFIYDEEDFSGIYSEPYCRGSWIHISDMDEFHIWQRPDSREGCVDTPTGLGNVSASITSSELNFKRDYEERTRRMIHRKSYVEALHRKASKTLDSDKICTVRKTPSGSFGFRIFGDYPTVVTAIEPNMPAENSGLEVGDIIMRINNIYVANSSHNDVLEITKAVSDTMELEVARTCDVLTPSLSNLSSRNLHVFSGPLWKYSVSGEIWVQRHFCLKQDNCLYYYKTESETIPLGALVLHDTSVESPSGKERPYSFRITKPNQYLLDLAAESESVANQWLEYFNKACSSQENIEWLSDASIKKPPSRILSPQHSGHLFVLGRSWKRRFCVLKNACLYIYSDISTDAAIGMICMHGYKIRSTTLLGKKFSFEIYPEDVLSDLKHFYFHADSDMDKKRWMAEMEYSLGRWIRLL
uniref:Na(+)/H(+) exchange regulatory cofactor NHE-RF1 n=1 Tax=Cacopsylla melanoneura TaxID=428564 RepID=A0A8D8Z116_9HEMI